MEQKNLLQEALNMSKWEKIDSGVHTFTLKNVEHRLTDKSKRDALVYNGTIINSKGLEQVVNVVDIIDSDDAFKFGATRLIQFCNYFNLQLNNLESIDDIVVVANQVQGKSLKLEFVKKIVNGATIKEKMFILK